MVSLPKHVVSLILFFVVNGLFSCAKPVDDIDRTQPNALEKELFQGEWYFARTVVDVPFESDASFIGDRQEYLFGSDDFPAYKVRWRIEERRLMACRVEEIVIGGNSEGQGDEIDPQKQESRRTNALDPDDPEWEKFPCTHPVASFRIEKHFDIQRSYNAATGEQSNVLVENAMDRHWHQRAYMRVNWTDQSTSEIDYNLFASQEMGWVGRISNPYFVQAEPNDCRREVSAGIMDYSDCEEGYLPPVFDDDNNDGTPDSILITNRMTISPWRGFFGCFYADYFNWGTPCTNNEVGMRLSFMRVPEQNDETAFEPMYYTDEMFERFGVWRAIKFTYLNGRGQTDFKEFLGTRFQIWDRTYDCSGESCSRIPLDERTVRPIVYYLNRAFPKDLIPSAFEVAKQWNDAFDGIPHRVAEGVSQKFSESCKVVCGPEGKPASECTAADPDWRMEGVCAFKLEENNHNQFLGDLRYNYIAFIEDPGQGQPCGVGGPANDPETGELINAVAYVYGAGCFDYINTRVADMIDIICAQAQQANDSDSLPRVCDSIDEAQYLRGLRVLELLQEQGYRQPPRTPIRGLSNAMSSHRGEATSDRMEDIRQNFEELEHHRGSLHSARQAIINSGLSRALIPDELAREATLGAARSAADLTHEEAAQIDPFNWFKTDIHSDRRQLEHFASRAVEPAEFLFDEKGLWAFVSRNKDLSRKALLARVRQNAFKAVTLHEIGHNMGLRHNFIASFDRTNYQKEYWDIKEAAQERFEEAYGRAAPLFSPFRDSDETEEQFGDRYVDWSQDRELLRDIEKELGLREVRYSSIMDYHGSLFADWQGLGDYDKAAMRFLYGGLVDRVECAGTQPEDCLMQNAEGVRALHDREYVQWYVGGELCTSDDDCPATEFGQKCRPDQVLAASFCSNWDDDELASGRFNPRHAFCSDDRVADQPFCNRFDEGESSEEIVRNAIDDYERGFVFNNFRRYRSGFSIRSYVRRVWSRYFSVIGNQMQSLLYKYYYEPGFRANDGPGGFDDMFRATITGFELFGNILAMPQAGHYQWNEENQVYEFQDKFLIDEALTSQDRINIPLGQGKTLYSSYEEGYYGEIERLSYVGIVYDKILAMQALTARDWGADAGQNDERFLLSFYDFFPTAYTRLLGSFIAGQSDNAGMTYNPAGGMLEERAFWDGSFFDGIVEFSDQYVVPEGRKVEPGASSFLDNYALIYALVDTPVFFDLSFLGKVRVFEVGGNTGYDFSHLSPDSVSECISPITGRRFASTTQDSSTYNIAVEALTRCQSLAEEYSEFNVALEANSQDPRVALPGDMSRAEAEQRFNRLRNQMTNQEDLLSKIVYIFDIVGIGRL